MTFLVTDAQKNLLTIQKSQLQFELTLTMNRANYISKRMGYIATKLEGTNKDLDEDPTYAALQADESYLETRQDSIESQLSIIDNEINSLKTLVNNSIKSSCSLNLIGG